MNFLAKLTIFGFATTPKEKAGKFILVYGGLWNPPKEIEERNEYVQAMGEGVKKATLVHRIPIPYIHPSSYPPPSSPMYHILLLPLLYI